MKSEKQVRTRMNELIQEKKTLVFPMNKIRIGKEIQVLEWVLE